MTNIPDKIADLNNYPKFKRQLGETIVWNPEMQTWMRWKKVKGQICDVYFVNEKGEWERGEESTNLTEEEILNDNR